MTDKQCERVKGREDDGEWLIIDLCDDNGVFSFSFPHRDVTLGADLNRFNEIGFGFDVFIYRRYTLFLSSFVLLKF
jgi:hypothetical protein